MISLEACARRVLHDYPPWLRGKLVFLGNHGGFSGARLWRLETSLASYCLKAWATDARSPTELRWIHDLLHRASRFAWMPRVVPTSGGATFVALQDRLWEITTWMPGSANFADAPSIPRLDAACAALAQLHQCWAPLSTSRDVCPAVLRRWDSWLIWQHLLQTGWTPLFSVRDPWTTHAGQLWQRLQERIEEVPRRLTPWLVANVPIQPCVCDLWHDHVLFTGDRVTGLIDFGSVKEDHVAVDLARLLGSLIADDAMLWKIGVSSYSRIHPVSDEAQRLARDLDRTGTILAATHWLRWLYHEGRTFDDPAAVCKRLTHLVRRLSLADDGG